MKNKGFTLIELLAIIIILGIIATIAGVAVTKSVKNTEGKASDIQVKNIKTAAKTWASANPYILPEVGKTLTISLNTLIAGGYIGNNGGDISNPSNDKYYSRSKTMIEITNNNGIEINISGVSVRSDADIQTITDEIIRKIKLEKTFWIA